MKVLAIGGESAVGKTTLMKKIIPSLGDGRSIKYKTLYATIYDTPKVILAGRYDDSSQVFQGTDRLSLTCQKDSLEFLNLHGQAHSEYLFMFEGDRFFRNDFIKGLEEHKHSFLPIILQMSEFVRSQRHMDRQPLQKSSVLSGRTTKYRRIISEMNPIVRDSNNSDDAAANLKFLQNIIASHQCKIGQRQSTGQVTQTHFPEAVSQ